nr:hypothetical protein [Tanacetum cinerariifolium]
MSTLRERRNAGRAARTIHVYSETNSVKLLPFYDNAFSMRTAKPITTAGEVVTTTVKDSAAPTTNVTKDDITMDQALAAIMSIKPKVVVQEQEMSTTISATTTTVTTAVPTPRAKGKAKMIEPDVPIKKKYQMRIDKELQARERKEFSKVQKARLLAELIGKRKKYFAALRAQKKRNKPPTKTQMKSQMSTYLKHIAMDLEAQESNTKRTAEHIESNNSKKQKVDENVKQKKTYFKIIREDDRFKKENPVDEMDNLLFRTLKTMFEHHVEDNIWKYQQGLVKVYPLIRNTLHQLWSDVRLQVDHDVEMAYDLLRFIRKQLMEGYTPQ